MTTISPESKEKIGVLQSEGHIILHTFILAGKWDYICAMAHFTVELLLHGLTAQFVLALLPQKMVWEFAYHFGPWEVWTIGRSCRLAN